MSIITPSIFVGKIAIPQTANYFENGGDVQLFIDDYEPIFMKELFGVTFYNKITAGLLLTPPDNQIWLDLVNTTDLKQMIAHYVYYYWKIDETTQSMGISEAKPKAENANVTNSIDKQVARWNDMVKMVRLFDLSTITYPDFVRRYWRSYDIWFENCEIPEIYYFKNTLGF